MEYLVYSPDDAVVEATKAYAKDDTVTVCDPSSFFWNLSFLPSSIVIVEVNDEESLDKHRGFCPSSIPMVFLLAEKSEAKGLISVRPETIVLKKPLNSTAFRKALADAKHASFLLEEASETIVGHSESLSRLRSEIVRAALSTCPVHIWGETGTGKTLSARTIHVLSGNRKPMVYVNCSNLQSSLSDSDIFGHIKGAYTSASSPRAGLLGEANGTTLFLDEIGDIPYDVQGKLLDVLENGTYRSMGSDQEKKTCFRLVTAGKESLEELVEDKKLRQDFYYRISSLEIEIPPLRKHLEDIPDLVRHYLGNNNQKDFFQGDYSALRQGSWKGNVRELIHYLDRLSFGH